MPAFPPRDSLNVSFAPYIGFARALIFRPAKNTMHEVYRILIEALRMDREPIVGLVVEPRGSMSQKANGS